MWFDISSLDENLPLSRFFETAQNMQLLTHFFEIRICELVMVSDMTANGTIYLTHVKNCLGVSASILQIGRVVHF